MDEQNYKFKGDGLIQEEKKLGKKMFQLYRETYDIESASDLPLLEELIYRELRQIDIKNQISEFKTEEKNIQNKNQVPKKFIDALDENLEQIIKLKETLGFMQEKEQKGIYEYIKVLEKKFRMHREENQATYQFKCANCSEMALLCMRVDAYEVFKHPMFKDNYLQNKRVWELYREGTITKLDVAKILLGNEVNSTDYVDWLEKKLENPSK